MKLQLCKQILQQDGIIAYPTEAVWGLGCDPFSHIAVERLLAIKKRDWRKGLIVVAANIEQLKFLIHDLDAEKRAQLQATWPGAHTWLIPHKERFPEWVTGEHNSIAVRISDHPLIQQICAEFGGPIISTSANLAGKAPARSRIRVQQVFANKIDYVVPGELGGNKNASVIKDLITGKVLRA